MKTDFCSIGISHWNCPLEARELFSMDRSKSEDLIKEAQSFDTQSIFTISTCNRTQIFARKANLPQLKKLFIKYTGNHKDEFKKYGFVMQDEDAVSQLFEVSTGIDSQILGDLQIFSQVKEGVKQAKKLNAIDSTMDRLLQFVFQANKEVQSFTSISKGAASVAHAAVLHVKSKFESIKDKNILLFGTGEIGERTLENLNNHSFKKITVVNRTLEKAQQIAETHKASYSPIENLEQEIKKSDIIIVATSAKNYSVKHKMVEGITDKKLFIDLSVPRNIDPEIAKVNNFELIDMDQLNSQADQTLEVRKKDIPKAKTIINLHKIEFDDWQKLHQLGPTIKRLEDVFEKEKESEINKYKGQYSTKEIEKMKPLINSIVKKISSKNIEYLRKRFRYDEEILEVIQEMYKIQ